MEKLLEKINEYNKKRPVYTSFMTIVNPSYLKPDIFGDDFFSDDLNKIIKMLPENNFLEMSTKNYFIGIKKQIENSPSQSEEIKKLHHFLNSIDKRRNLNYTTVFPWLEKYFLDNHIVVS